MKVKVLFVVIMVLTSSYLFANENPWPIDIKISQSSSFAEFRGLRFHAGIDLRTQHKTGFPVKAIADGYISRIKVQFRGYGYGLYITYPGLKCMTVYGHLNDFAGPSAVYVQKKLRKLNKRFGIDDTFGPGKFPVKKGQIVGFTGETGAGPAHLHFEMRDLNNNPIAPALYGYRPPDNIFPKMYNLYIEPLSYAVKINNCYQSSKIKLKKISKTKYVWKKIVKASGPIGFKIGVLDTNGCGNYFGVEKVELKFNQKLAFIRTFHKFSYTTNRQCPWVYDYKLSYMRGTGFVCILYKYPFETLPFSQDFSPWSGLLDNTVGEIVNVEINAIDFGGNKITASGRVQFEKNIENLNKKALEFSINKSFQTNFSYVAQGTLLSKTKDVTGYVMCKDHKGIFDKIPYTIKGKHIQFAFPKEKKWEKGAWYNKKRMLPDSSLINSDGGKLTQGDEAEVEFSKNSAHFSQFCSLVKSTKKLLPYKKKGGVLKPVSSAWTIFPSRKVWDKPIKIGLSPTVSLKNSLKRIGIYRINNNGRYSHQGETVKHGKFWLSTRMSGSFLLMEDDAFPRLWYKGRGNIHHLGKSWVFGTSDLGEGVNYLSAKAIVDGKAAETYSDPDKSEIYVVRKANKKKHKIVLTVYDYAGNEKKIRIVKK